MDACDSSRAAGSVPPSPACAVAQTLRRLLEEEPLVVACLAVAPRPSSRSDCSLHQRIRPFAGEEVGRRGDRCTPATTASADFSRPVPRRCRRGSPDRPDRARRPPRVSCVSFPRASPDLPACAVRMTIGRPRPLPRYPTHAGLVSGFCSSSPSFGIGFLQIPPRDGHPCLALRFRSSRPAENLHLRDTKHAWQTKRRVP